MAVVLIGGTALAILAAPAFAAPAPIPISNGSIDESSANWDIPLNIPVITSNFGLFTVGILGLCEVPLGPNGSCATLSDSISFPEVNVNGMFHTFPGFQSDVEGTTGDSPADSCIPTPFILCLSSSGGKNIAETVNENGVETMLYTPGPGDPGYLMNSQGGSANLTYTITSDSPVPEPSTLALVVSGMAPLGLGYLRRRGRP